MNKSLIVVLISIACASCANMPAVNIGSLNLADVGRAVTTVNKAVEGQRDLNQEEEIALGSGVASNLLGAAPLLNNPPLQRYVSLVGRRVAAQSERADLPWHFAVLDDMEFNAFATPGGFIFITRGLLVSLRNEAELAGVLGHEVAHVVRKHHLQAMKKAAGSAALSELGSFMLEKNPQLTRNGVLTPALNKLASVGTELYTKGLDKDDEFEADRMGVVLAARAGYDPYGLPASLQTLQGVNPNEKGLALLFKTHPTFQARLEMLAKVMDTAFDPYENQPNVAARFKATVFSGPAKKAK